MIYNINNYHFHFNNKNLIDLKMDIQENITHIEYLLEMLNNFMHI